MKKTLLISGVLLALAASTAMAGGVNLAWTECRGGGGADNRLFACTSNTGSNTLTASFTPNADLPDAVGNELRIDLEASGGALPAWWDMFNSGSCRGTGVPTVNTTFPGGCFDNYAGAGFGVVASYSNQPSTPPGRRGLLVGWALATGSEFPLDQLTEYYAINVAISNARTVGTGACAGCQTPVCLVLNVVTVAYGPQATLTHTIDLPLVRNWVTWQGPSTGTVLCPDAVPNQSRTWGQVKSLYR